MNVVERILSKVVGQDITAEELAEISGGMIDICQAAGGYGTIEDGANATCDFS